VVASLVASGVVVLALPAQATFHFVRVRQVFAGLPGHPDVQYVELQSFQACCQNLFQGHSVEVFDAKGKRVGVFTFQNNVVNGGSQATTLIETPAAADFFGVSADLSMTPVIDPAGGKVCWARDSNVDCVSWGHYTGKPTGAGDPFDEQEGIVSGTAMDRIVSGGSNKNGLDEKDDRNDSAKDFHFAAPAPTNNLNQSGSAPGGVLSFARAYWKVKENGGSVTITVTRSGGTGAVEVAYSTKDGTATGGKDYAPASGTLSLAEGETSKTFSVRIKNDTMHEGTETVRLLLRRPTGDSVLGTPDATVRITDDHPPAPRGGAGGAPS
jgi:hypothetical protein